MRPGKLIAVIAALACWAALPSAAHALSAPVPKAASEALGQAESTVAATVAPVAGPVTEPSRPRPVHEAVAPVAQSAGPTAQSAAASIPQAAAGAASPVRLQEPSRQQVRRIAASSSAGRMSSERVAHGPRLFGATRLSSERTAPAHRPAAGPRPTPLAPEAAAARSADPAPFSGAPGSGASGGSAPAFFFGGGFALLVASLLLAGPFLRRRLSLSPAVCRPAAFLVVLERPG